MLTIHRAVGTAPLAAALAELLRRPLPDPFTAEVVAVPAKGVERWLSQRLATALGTTDAGSDDGVAANVRFLSPARLVAEVLAVADGTDPDDDPWSPAALPWEVLRTIDANLSADWCTVLRAHLHGEHRITRRWATAAHLAELWRSYAAERPQMLRDWAEGRFTDGLGADLPADLHWQARLWSAVREDARIPSPAERLPAACDRLRTDPAQVDLPPRLSLFGATRLSTEQLTVLTALGAGREVHLWVPHPSPAMWAALGEREAPRRRRADDSALQVDHPLLASLARDTRELQSRLGPLAAADVEHPPVAAPAGAGSLLARLQADLAADRPPGGAGADLTPPDDSVQVHACHGPTRQVEVLREVLLHLFAADPTLEPRDVLVMCPDVEAFAPLVRAAFGQGAAGDHPGHRLRVRLADRALRRTNPVLDTLAGLLHLADGRVTATQVLDLAAQEPVRRMFRLSDDDLERLQTWAGSTGVRWGIGTGQRTAYGLGALRQNTWTTGLDRLLLGVAADESGWGWLDTALPLDDVASNDIDLVGRLAELIDRLHATLHRLQGAQPARRWKEHLDLALEVFCATAPADAWQTAEARREIADALQHAGDVELRLADVRALLTSRLGGRPTRANFRTGELTVATLVPMRSVPHRVVVLLGLDDDVFPRSAGVDGDDVLARDPAPGERDRRGEDRQLLLDAVVSAGDTLVVLYTGADPVNGQRRPPAVPVGELLDVIAATTGTDIVRRHPLQPFDRANFASNGPFSHDRSALAGARAAARPRQPAPRLLDRALSPPDRGDLTLTELVGFVVHPVQALLRQRLGLYLTQYDDDVADALSAQLDNLQQWQVGERMLAGRLAGVPAVRWRQAEWRRGTLPPQRLGERLLDTLEAKVDPVAVAVDPWHGADPTTYDIAVDLDGRRLTGTVPGVREGVVVQASYSRLSVRQRLTAWVHLLALAAATTPPPGLQWRAVSVGRGSRAAATSLLRAPAAPRELLADLVALRDEGLAAPLPLPPKAGAEYAIRRHGGEPTNDALSGAQATFCGPFGDEKDLDLRYVELDAWSDIVAEAGTGGEPTRFGDLARRLWDPLLCHERWDR